MRLNTLWSLLLVSILGLAGCTLYAHDNPIYGKWKLTKVSAVHGANADVLSIVRLLDSRMRGEVYNFEPGKLTVTAQNGNTVSMKVIKYEVKDGRKKVIVVQKQRKLGVDFVEYQPAVLYDGGRRMDLTSGEVILHFVQY